MLKNTKEYFKRFFKDYFKSMSTKQIAWLMSAIALVIGALFISWDSSNLLMQLLIAVGTITGTICVILVSNQKISNYLFGIVNVLCFGIMYAMLGMWGMSAVNLLYFLPMQFIGFFWWLKKESSNDTTQVRWAKPYENVGIFLSFIFGTILIYWVLSLFPGLFTSFEIALPIADERLRWLDAGGTMGNILGQLLLTFAIVNQWFIWFIVDITQIIAFAYLFIFKTETYYLSMLILYLVWTVNVIIGFISWIKEAKR